ncbi:MAG: hypothetical protein Q7K26_06705 [bacterium]|nr:hypothetical protein [bacterium]
MNMNISIFGLPYIESAFILSTIGGGVVYLMTWLALSGRDIAKSQIGSVVMAGILLSPWWSAVAGAVLGHFMMVMLIDILKKKRASALPPLFMTIALAGHLVVSLQMQRSAQSEIDSIKLASIQENWKTIQEKNESGDYVYRHFKDCSDAEVTCINSTLQMAEREKGKEFSQLVKTEIENYLKEPKLSSEASEKIKRITSKFQPLVVASK